MAIRILNSTDELNPGDVVEFVYYVVGPIYWQAIHLGAIEKRLEANPKLRYLSYTYPDEGQRTIAFKVKVVTPRASDEQQVQNASILAGVVSASIMVGTVALWLSLREIRLNSEAGGGPITQLAGTAKAGFTFATVAIVGLAAFVVAKKARWI